MRKKITPGQRVQIGFTPRERMLVFDDTFAGPELTNVLRQASLVDGRHVASYTLGDLDELFGYVAAETNHSMDERIRRELDALYGRLRREMESYDDGMWQETF